MSRIDYVPLPVRGLLFGRKYVNLVRLIRKGRVSMGRGSYGVPNVETFAFDATKLAIGSFTSIANGVTFILGGNHPTDRVTTYPLRTMHTLPGAGTDGFPYSKGDITVKSDVWIGHGSVILSGVTIGNGAVVSARSLVISDVPDYAIVGGNPARVIRFRHEEATRDELLRVAWWNWPDAKIDAYADLLCGKNIAAFISAAEADSILYGDS